jgi:hypothetical protein
MAEARAQRAATAIPQPALRAAGIGLLAALATAAVMGVPTDVVPNPWFERKLAATPFDVVVLIALSLLAGALTVTYAIPAAAAAKGGRRGIGSGILGWFAISCPACNKLVVALIGVSGATGWFAAVQPALGAGAVALAVAALAARVRTIKRGTCPLPDVTSQPSSQPRRAGRRRATRETRRSRRWSA